MYRCYKPEKWQTARHTKSQNVENTPPRRKHHIIFISTSLFCCQRQLYLSDDGWGTLSLPQAHVATSKGKLCLNEDPPVTIIFRFYFIRTFSTGIQTIMLKIKRDIDQQDFKIVDLRFVKSETFSLTWSCGSRERDTTSGGWKFQLNNLTVKTIKSSS